MFEGGMISGICGLFAGSTAKVAIVEKRKAPQPTDEKKAKQKKRRLELAENGAQLRKFDTALGARVARELKKRIGGEWSNFLQLRDIHPRMVAILFLAFHPQEEQISVFSPIMPIDWPTFMFVDFDKVGEMAQLLRRIEKFYSKCGCKYVDKELSGKPLRVLEDEQDTDGVLTIRYHASADSFVRLPKERDYNVYRENIKGQKGSDATKVALTPDVEYLITAQPGQGCTAQHWKP